MKTLIRLFIIVLFIFIWSNFFQLSVSFKTSAPLSPAQLQYFISTYGLPESLLSDPPDFKHTDFRVNKSLWTGMFTAYQLRQEPVVNTVHISLIFIPRMLLESGNDVPPQNTPVPNTK